MIKQFKIAELRYIKKIMTAEICYFNTHYPTGHNFHTLFKKKKQKIIIDYFKGLLMTHHLDIFMSGKNLGLNGLKQYHICNHAYNQKKKKTLACDVA